MFLLSPGAELLAIFCRFELMRKTPACLIACLSWLSLWLGGCDVGADLRPVQHGAYFRMLLPRWLDSLETRHGEAQFQYGNRRRNLFVSVRYDSLTALQRRYPRHALEDYYDQHLERLIEPMRDVRAPAPDSLRLATCPALLGHFDGTFKKDDLHFSLLLVQDHLWLFQVLVWMPRKRYTEWEDMTTRMLRSFEPIPPPFIDQEK